MDEALIKDDIVIRKPAESPYEKILTEIARATTADVKAVQDYNIMMGILEDPCEEEEVE